ncbi:MAG: S8 family serine peptidase [Sphingopyxis sp.]|nr:S8 family serine peptidase [Sphingopyxis sp.]
MIERDTLDGLGLRMLVFKIPSGMLGPAAIRQLEAFEPGVTAGVNHAYTLSQARAPRPRVFASRKLSWPDQGCASRFPAIGMIDGPVDIDERSLAGARVQQRIFGGQPSGESLDHGTTTAAILIGEGRLRRTQLYSASVIADYRQRNQVASVDNLLRALNWMKISRVRLVNISLEGPYNRLLDRGFQQALGDGMIVVASVGNGGPQSPPRFPASFAGVVGITAVDAGNAIYSSAARGGQVDFAAPGVDVFVPTDAGGRYVTGTSVAAPFVTAIIAAQSSPRDSVKSITAGLARSSVDLGVRGRDTIYGSGLARLAATCG